MNLAFFFFLGAAFSVVFAAPIQGQVVVDKTVATVSDGSSTELITRSDLVWQLALQRGVPIDPPREEDLREALKKQIEQRIFALEARRLPRAAPTDDEIKKAIGELLEHVDPVEFQRRLRAVGFASVGDENFENIIAQRVAIEKYIDFRFRSFVVVTSDDELVHYRDTWVPNFRKLNPGREVPSIDEARALVNKDIIEQRAAANMESFLEEAKRRVQIVIISEPTL